ncbi:helix-turn-helix domain-containing protein [Salinicola rhizosphaerae]|uniref:Transcriptional regulator n=1 Tax=Salinicola rhizosphaerae TaxID=1443141 RepID=A0ABQ3E957_9GAMM|nr:helix-turn-helix transcriptional regulator [Salinicola rhizosphaerae]GHB27441.1 transcriptional regulator [Salinicola rhizosphaerae]
MNAHTENVQIINGPDGAPAYVVIPYQDYLASHSAPDLIPNEVVGIVVNEDTTMVAAWRRYLGLTQAQVAERIGISQSAYAQQEAARKPRLPTLEKIATALGLTVEQLSEE